MNIIWIYDQEQNPNAGGTERITYLISKGLSNKGYKTFGILVFNKNKDIILYNGKIIDDLYDFLKTKNINIVINQIAYSKWLLEMFLERGGYIWKNKGGKIISCLHFDPCNPSLLYLRKSKLKKTYKDYFYILQAFLLYPYYKEIQKKTEGKIYNYIYDNSDKFIILSSSHMDYLKMVMKRTDYNKLSIINNPLSFEGTLTSLDLKNKKKIILICSRMSEYHKRISIILKIWRYFQKKKLNEGWIMKLVGDGSDLMNYKEYVKKNRLNNIYFEGQQSPELYYKEASILLSTSNKEGWGLVLTEALQYGVLPIALNTSSVFSEIINNEYNGFLVSSYKNMIKVLSSIMKDPDKIEEMQKNALISSKRFKLENIIEHWDNLLQNIDKIK